MTRAQAITHLGAAPSVVLAPHTTLEARPTGPVVVFRAIGDGRPGRAETVSVDIVAFQPDGSIVLNSGGQASPAVKARINNYLPKGISWSVYAYALGRARRTWYLVGPGKAPVPFVDGVMIKADGTLVQP